MASKPKRRPENAVIATNAPLRQEVDRFLAKERYKDAVRQAKICYKQEPTAEHHRLLERAYFLRASQLKQGGMSNAAQEVAHHLLEFGITDPELEVPVAELFLAVGMAAQALKIQDKITAPEARERLTLKAADEAVLATGPLASSLSAEIREDALKVRQALEAIQAGDEAKGLAELQHVARTSPFADWRLFVRGWAAFRRRQDAEARSNWDRLNPDRAAAKIAASLLALAGTAPWDAATTAKLEKLEHWACGVSILKPIQQLSERIIQGDWAEVTSLLRTLRPALVRIDPSMAVRITQSLYAPLLRHAMNLSLREAERLVRAVIKVTEPLPIDPHWNRFWAMAWEEATEEIEGAESYWRNYLEDLKTSTALRPEERDHARAMVLTRIGKALVELADDMAPEESEKPDSDCKDARKEAVACLEESVKLFPGYLTAYQMLRDAYEEWKEPDRAAEISRRLLSVVDDFDTLLFLAEHHFKRGEPAASLEYAVRARVLRPLDKKAKQCEWKSRVALGRKLAMDGDFERARAEMQTADHLLPETCHGPMFAARKAGLELMAGQDVLAQEIINDALAELVEATPLWLALNIEAIRIKLPKAERDRFEGLWLKAIVKKVRGETAGALADLLGSYLNSKIDYPGRSRHIKMVADYLRRTTRIKYTSQNDLLRVCAFLALASEKVLYEKLVNRGVKLFPGSPEFLLMLSAIELDKNPYRRNVTAIRRRLEKALTLAQSNEETESGRADLIPAIKQMLSRVDNLINSPLGGYPFGAPGGPMSSRDLMNAFAAMLDQADFDPDEEF